jgi:signal transduction histidine kinase
LTIVTALVFIAGPPILAIDYLAKVVSRAIKVALYRRGRYLPPVLLRPLLDAQLAGRPAPREALVDLWANHATNATGLAIRWLCFRLLLTRFPPLPPLVAVLAAEVVGQTYWVLLHVAVPLPTSTWFAKSRRPWSNFGLDEHTDVAFAMFVFLPFWVLVVYWAGATYGLGGLAVGALSTLAPHYVLKLLNDRRETTARLQAANRALEEKARALEKKQEELRSFVYTVTHDLKNPLSAIQITADLLRESDGPRCSPEGREHLERIMRIAGATEDMIRDLLELFRATSNEEVADWVSLEDVTNRVMEDLGPQIASKAVRVTMKGLPRLWGQRRNIERLVSNLVSNAVKYVPAGRGTIELSGQCKDGRVALCVADNGIGIPPAYHEGIFHLFGRVPTKEQTVEGRVVAGSGVGLAIVKRIVEAHAGEVWVESEPGAGSRFYVVLPVPPAASAPSA